MTNLKLINKTIASEIDPAFKKRSMAIMEAIINGKPKRILDAGCGRGFYIKLISSLDFPVEIVGIDLSKEYLKVARKNINDQRVKLISKSIYQIPYQDNYFDCVICSEVLEHLDDDQKAIEEINRITKKNGLLLITVPHDNYPFFWDPINWLLTKIFSRHINPNIWWLAGIWADHQRLYSEDTIIKLVKDSQYKINHIVRIISHCYPFSHFIFYVKLEKENCVTELNQPV